MRAPRENGGDKDENTESARFPYGQSDKVIQQTRNQPSSQHPDTIVLHSCLTGSRGGISLSYIL